MQLGQLIEAAAKVAGTQRALAGMLGVPETRISNWKNGTGGHVPSPEDVALLAYIAGYDAADALVRAVLHQHRGTEKGKRLEAALGKFARATGAGVTFITSTAVALFAWASLTLSPQPATAAPLTSDNV